MLEGTYIKTKKTKTDIDNTHHHLQHLSGSSTCTSPFLLSKFTLIFFWPEPDMLGILVAVRVGVSVSVEVMVLVRVGVLVAVAERREGVAFFAFFSSVQGVRVRCPSPSNPLQAS